MTERLWYKQLGIERPRFDVVAKRRTATRFSLMVAALLEADRPLTMREICERFEAAGIASAAVALASLRKARPERSPVYKVGELYELDVKDDEMFFQLCDAGLQPPRPARVAAPSAPIEADPTVPVSIAELDEAWAGASLSAWSAQRVAVAAIEALGRPLAPAEAVAFVAARTPYHRLRVTTEGFGNAGSAIMVLADGRWDIAPGADATREAVRLRARELIASARKRAVLRQTPAEEASMIAAYEQQRVERARASLEARRAVLAVYPKVSPQWAVLADLATRTLKRFDPSTIAGLNEALAGYDAIAGLELRATLRSLHFDQGERRLAELGPPQKSLTVDDRGHKVMLTTDLLVQSSCMVRKSLSGNEKLATAASRGKAESVFALLEQDVRLLAGLYRYGLLHRGFRVRGRGFDESVPVPWFEREFGSVWEFAKRARENHLEVEAVVGPMPALEDPWRDARVLYALPELRWDFPFFMDADGALIMTHDIQMLRFHVERH
jgi:hypothetical protein